MKNGEATNLYQQLVANAEEPRSARERRVRRLRQVIHTVLLEQGTSLLGNQVELLAEEIIARTSAWV